MLRRLQTQADDLAESLLICDLEMRRSRTLSQRLDAYSEFGGLVDKIDALRREAELLLTGDREALFDRLDSQVARSMRSLPYRTLEWIDGEELSWFIEASAAEFPV